MNIVVVGDGKVGYALSEQLNLEGHNITIIDNDQKTLDSTLETLDVLCVRGNGATQDVQREAGVPDSDLLIAATSADELNMICCLTASHLGAKHTIARIRNPDYVKQLNTLKEQFKLSMVINPELESASEIARVIEFPPALKVDIFSRGNVELVEMRLQASSPIVDKRLMDVRFKPGEKVLICAVDRNEEVFIPNGNFILRQDDKIYVTGRRRAISAFIYSIGDFPRMIRSVIIVGGGKIGYYLANALGERRYQIKIIEKDPERCAELCELLPKAMIIQGDGSNMKLLESEGLDKADAFVSLTDIDEENIVMSMVASGKNVPKVVTRVSRFNYLGMIGRIGLDAVVSPPLITANQITQYVRAMQNTGGESKMDTLHKFASGKAEAAEFTVMPGSPHIGVPLESLPLKENLLIAVIVRDERTIIPNGKDFIRETDSIVVVTAGGRKLNNIYDIFKD